MPEPTRDVAAIETPVAAAARTTSGDSGVLSGYWTASQLAVQLSVTAASGTSPTLNAVVEDTLDGANWFVIGTFAQRIAAGQELLRISTPFADRLRIRWTIAGTTPSFTFSVLVYAQ